MTVCWEFEQCIEPELVISTIVLFGFMLYIIIEFFMPEVRREV